MLNWEDATDLIIAGDSHKLSTYIHLDIPTFEVKFIYMPAHIFDGRFWLVEMMYGAWVALELNQELSGEDDLHKRLQNEYFTCLVLPENNKGPDRHAIVVDWEGDVAYRIGIVRLSPGFEKLREVRRNIKLG